MADEKRVRKFKESRIKMAWLLCIIGILFCFAGAYHFKSNVFEEDKSVRPSVYVMLMGIILISIGTAKYFGIIS